MAKGRFISILIAALCAVSMALVPVASAYKVPGIPPGKPGGPPTKPKGGGSTTKGGAGKVGGKVAGFTGSELAKKGKITVTVHFPKAGKLSAELKADKTTLGDGSVSANKAVDRDLNINFSKSGKKFLNKHNGQAIRVTVSFTFVPKHGKTSTSTSEVTLDA